ncbi:mfs general substrate transporter [Penicillium digitatum]|uniref:Uncharacterized protein n=3 Tax=Penicillium digitatum TaxID=36651 RepID=K9FEY0_PEND2|nr:hypothetical protein PDIP_79820 [Penicillium digitatum Pd1]EKV06357.1 hypothetical protein PDIP_79820 [Penicillium digitatum Pd1]EKV07975.1 hypothetical protein PDIG_70510 [Penicillium digitatum PHI26]KAG0161098.1 hypothetical protein PDIDSM_8631 [Penicillium digitatum]QQK40632.1 mfs general substrate transporter [Penicillium digitatum]
MAPLGQTIAVIDKSGQVVSTTRHLLGVFSHAKNVYREHKSAFQSERNAKIAEQQALQGLANYQIDDAPSVAASRRSRGTRSRHHSGRSHCASSAYDDEQTAVSWQDSPYEPPQTLARHHTNHDLSVPDHDARSSTTRFRTDAHIDMDLAYGDASHAALSRYSPPEPKDDQQQLDSLVNRAEWLLEEAHCMQQGATAAIAHLQKNPQAMAAVALTLAEISNLGSKMAPAALTTLKSAAPVVFALLASPQFLIAAGVGIGVTVVMFGGYKIIQKIRAGATGDEGKPAETEMELEAEMEEMIEFNTEDLSSVEMWRRGVADEQVYSVGTSVDGEFITPTAAAMSGIDVTTARARRDPRFKFDEDASVASSRRSRRSRTTLAPTHAPSERHEQRSKAPSEAPSGFFGRSSSRSKAPSKDPSRAPSRAPGRGPSRTSSKHSTHVSESEKRPKEKKKGPSRLRLMFTSSS